MHLEHITLLEVEAVIRLAKGRTHVAVGSGVWFDAGGVDRNNRAADFKYGNEVTTEGKLLGETLAAERESTRAGTSLKTRADTQTKILPTRAGLKPMRG